MTAQKRELGRTPFPEWDEIKRWEHHPLIRSRQMAMLYWWLVVFIALVIANVVYDLM